MINLRYHIVSITAVFLALGIGIALGSTLIERATVDTLNDRLDEQSDRLDRTDGENADLREELAQIDEWEQQLTEQGVALYPGHLTDVPVVVLTLQGTDDELVAQTRRSLQASGASVTGVLRFTSRWETLSQDEVADIAQLLDRPLIRGPETREAALEALAAELLLAAEPAPEPVTATEPEIIGDVIVPSVDPSSTTSSSTTSSSTSIADGTVDGDDVVDPDAATNGTFLAALIERGFMEFVADGATAPLPEHGARFAFVLGGSDEVGVEDVVLPFVAFMATGEPAPMVVVETLPVPSDASEVVQPPLAGPAITAIRSDEVLVVRVSSADSAASFVGQSAMILALADLVGDDTTVGQYGVAVGATSLLPLLGE